ncbi:MAG: hypothetical protein ABR577_10505 [Pyrinomonadaceae bacterium]
MQKEQTTVADLFRRAQAIHAENPQLSYKDIKARIVDEFSGQPFPPVYNLTIPEQDARAPEEDWTAGLPLVLRGIQQEDWKEVASGIVLCLEQTENYQGQHGAQSRDTWHDRSVGIREPLTEGVSKWMPAGLLNLTGRTPKK